jgi:hypothetical protein
MPKVGMELAVRTARLDAVHAADRPPTFASFRGPRGGKTACLTTTSNSNRYPSQAMTPRANDRLNPFERQVG